MLSTILSKMFGWLKNVADYVLNFVYGALTIKAALFTGMAYMFSYVIDQITEHLNIGAAVDNLGTLWSQLPDGFFYYFGVFRLDFGIPAMLAAMVVRFGIRRLPIVG